MELNSGGAEGHGLQLVEAIEAPPLPFVHLRFRPLSGHLPLCSLHAKV